MEFQPEDHWVNNPLISPINKVAEYDKAIADAEKATEERIIKLLTEVAKQNPSFELSGELLIECTLEYLIALIKGEGIE